MDPDKEVEFELPTLCRIYRSGRVDRLIGTDIAPAGVDPATGVSSKDVLIDAASGLAVRLYLPPTSPEKKKLPILVYYHGGGFIIETPYSPNYHNYINSLSSRADILVVSVHYRRAPEHPLPAAYDDCWSALKWVAGAVSDDWLVEHGDLNRVFLSGDSAGGNIVHNMAIRAGVDSGAPEIEGILLVHPFFVSTEVATAGPAEMKVFMERFWAVIAPASTAGLDDPWINPFCAAALGLERLACRRVMVAVAEMDGLREIGKRYSERVKESGFGGDVEEVLDSMGENHEFHLLNPGCEKAAEMMDRVVAFFRTT